MIPISNELAQKIADYLGSKPYVEVAGLVSELHQAAQTAAAQEALLKTDKNEKDKK